MKTVVRLSACPHPGPYTTIPTSLSFPGWRGIFCLTADFVGILGFL